MITRFKNVIRAMAIRTPLPEILIHRGSARRLTVIALHRVGGVEEDNCPFDTDLFSVTAAELGREIAFLKRNLDVISVAEMADGLEKHSLPERPAVITFDDGYRDNYSLAYPVLTDAGVSACFFVSTHLVGTNSIPWWDQVACCFKRARVSEFTSPFGGDPFQCGLRDSAACAVVNQNANRYIAEMKKCRWHDAMRRLDDLKTETAVQPEYECDGRLMMSWDEVREMHRGGMEIGGHTRSHPIISKIDSEELIRQEIAGCRADLKRELKHDVAAFAYPEGNVEAMSELADTVISEAGFTISFSYIDKLGLRDTVSPWRIPRFHAEYGDDFGGFRVSLARALNR